MSEMLNTTVNMTWEAKRNKVFWFPQIVECDEFPIRRIHPLKQSQAYGIHKCFADNDDVAEIYLFGSSVNIRCHIHSDTDVAVLLKNDTREVRNQVSEQVQEICDWDADVVWLNGEDKNGKLYRDVLKGVRLK